MKAVRVAPTVPASISVAALETSIDWLAVGTPATPPGPPEKKFTPPPIVAANACVGRSPSRAGYAHADNEPVVAHPTGGTTVS